jgi:hypothetical protein
MALRARSAAIHAVPALDCKPFPDVRAAIPELMELPVNVIPLRAPM